MLKAHRLAALAALLVVGAATPANAIPVTYSTAGIFGSSGTNVLAQGGASIRFNPHGVTTVEVPPTTNALFGQFETLAAPASPGVTLVDTFTLTIIQTTPAPGGTAVFRSTVGGNIFLNNSQAFIQFNGPLTQTITSGGITTFYRIVEGDESNAGRLELFGGIGQMSTLNGEIGIQAPVPEPGTMALACTALPLLGLGYLRRRRRQSAS